MVSEELKCPPTWNRFAGNVSNRILWMRSFETNLENFFLSLEKCSYSFIQVFRTLFVPELLKVSEWFQRNLFETFPPKRPRFSKTDILTLLKGFNFWNLETFQRRNVWEMTWDFLICAFLGYFLSYYNSIFKSFFVEFCTSLIN